MTRKDFLKRLNFFVSGLAFYDWSLKNAGADQMNKMKIKNWLWFHPWRKISDDEYKKRLEKIKLAGIDAILPGIYGSWRALYQSGHLPVANTRLERLLPIAKSMGLEVHAWMWSMICNIDEIMNKHPDWFAINRNGESTIEKPAYVNYYRFMCPNHPEVREFVAKTVRELSAYSELDGVHLDYIRYPDVILAKKLQRKYEIIQDKEYPEYDYCYCEKCRSRFKDISGIDILKCNDPDLNNDWRQFRYDSITNLVNNFLIPPARKSGKVITAAVFPNWQHVRQQWSNWNVDAVFPMLYHQYYDEDIEWILTKIIEGKKALNSSTKLYCGLFVNSSNPKELIDIIRESLSVGPDGVSLFAYHKMKDEHWNLLSEFVSKNEL